MNVNHVQTSHIYLRFAVKMDIIHTGHFVIVNFKYFLILACKLRC